MMLSMERYAGLGPIDEETDREAEKSVIKPATATAGRKRPAPRRPIPVEMAHSIVGVKDEEPTDASSDEG